MNLFKRKETWIVLILIGILLVNRLSAIAKIKIEEDGYTVEIEELEVSNNEKSANEKVDNELIKVDISGEVNNPGVYELKKGDRVENVIVLAGGFTENADLNKINQAEFVNDRQKIIILGKGVDENSLSEEFEGPIDINSATRKQLMTLNGIGEVTAENIIKYREENGVFNEIEDLIKVPGIGENKLEMIKSDVVVY